jgi:rubredoxin
MGARMPASGSEHPCYSGSATPEPTYVKVCDMARVEDMWQCQTVNCGYVYDPERGDRKGKIPKGTLFEDLPEDWKCPVCGATRKMFRQAVRPAGSA